jgi:translation initiation factor 3 subunit K
MYAPRHPHLIPTFRHLFATSIASCFRKVNLSHIQEWLDLPQGEVEGWCKNVGWTVDGGVAVLPTNGDNDVKAGVVKENVELSRECIVCLVEGCG